MSDRRTEAPDPHRSENRNLAGDRDGDEPKPDLESEAAPEEDTNGAAAPAPNEKSDQASNDRANVSSTSHGWGVSAADKKLGRDDA